MPCFSRSSICAKFQSTVSPFPGVSAGEAFSTHSRAETFLKLTVHDKSRGKNIPFWPAFFPVSGKIGLQW